MEVNMIFLRISWRQLLWRKAAVILAVIFMIWTAAAADVVLKTGKDGDAALTDQNISPATLDKALDEANQYAQNSSVPPYEALIEIEINSDDLRNGSGPDSRDPLFWIRGSTSTTDPANIGAHGGFGSVTITGGAKGDDDYITIGFNPGTGNQRVLEIINVESSISLNKLHITGGKLDDTAIPNNTYLGGGGLYLGAVSGSGDYPYASAGVFAETITLTSIKISNNAVILESSGGGRAGMGGGAFIDATSYNGTSWNTTGADMAGGAVVFKDVDFHNNEVFVNGGAGDGSASFGGGVRIKNALSFTYSGGKISDNTSVTENGSHAAGGGIVIDDYTVKAVLGNLEITGNKAEAIDSGIPGTSKALGGGLYALHDGTTTDVESEDEDGNTIITPYDSLTLSVSSSVFTGNSAEATGTDVDAYGGAVYLNGNVHATFSGSLSSDDDGNISGTTVFEDNFAVSSDGNARGGAIGQGFYGAATDASLAISGVVFRGNYADAALEALGGAIYTMTETTITGTYFQANYADGAAAGGGAIHALAELEIKSSSFDSNYASGTLAQGGAVYASSANNIDFVSASFIGNYAEGVTAQGGAVYTSGNTTMESTTFSNNSVTGQAAQGGAVYSSATLNMTGGGFQGNIVNTSLNTSAAEGGAIYSSGGADILLADVTFKDNTAAGNYYDEDADITYNADARGGAIASYGTLSISGSVFSGNSAEAGESKSAHGGAVYFTGGGAGLIASSTFSENVASGGTDSTGTALGGAIYSENNLVLQDTSLIDNKAEGYTAQGGAVYMTTDSSASGAQLELRATAGSIVTISGNTTVSDGDTEANSIYFGGSGDQAGVLIVQTKEDSSINLLDGIRVAMGSGGSDFILDRSGSTDGTFVWGGTNHFNVDSGSSVINLTGGTTMLSKDFTAIAGADGTFEVNIDSIWGFDGQRDEEDGAMFNYTAITDPAKQIFTIASGTEINIDFSAELVDMERDFFVAKSYDGTDSSSGTYLSSDLSTESTVSVKNGDEIWISAKYTSTYNGLISASDRNTQSGINSGALVDIFRELSAENRALLTSSTYLFDSSTPGWFMNQMNVGRSIITNGAETALRYGAGRGILHHPEALETAMASSGQGLAFLAPAGFHNGPRFWAGYVGDFDRLDSNSGLHGYKSDRHGIMAGLNYDFGLASTIGLYGGYTSAKTKGRGVAAETESDIGHVGVIGRVTPFREIPQLSILGDAGYTFGDNDTTRSAGPLLTTGKFDQKFYTMGLEAEYVSCFGSLTAAPYLSARYVRARHDGFDETGLLASRIDKATGSAFTTRLGVSLSYDYVSGNGNSITPMLNLGWRHEFGDRQFSASTAYHDLPSISYKVRSTKTDKDTADIGLGIRTKMDLEDKMLGLNFGYNLNAGSNTRNHTVYVGFDLSF